MHINENIVNKLTDEQKSKVEAARSPEELLAFAKEAGYELTLEEISKVSGGSFCDRCFLDPCPKKELSW